MVWKPGGRGEGNEAQAAHKGGTPVRNRKTVVLPYCPSNWTIGTVHTPIGSSIIGSEGTGGGGGEACRGVCHEKTGKMASGREISGYGVAKAVNADSRLSVVGSFVYGLADFFRNSIRPTIQFNCATAVFPSTI